jgi:hypothetical protein
MLSFSRLKKLKLKGKLTNKRVVGGFLACLLVLLIGVAILMSQESPKKDINKQSESDIVRTLEQYTYVSSKVECKQLKPTPNATDTREFCFGTLKVIKDKTKETKEYQLGAAHFYRSGTEVNIQELSTLPNNSKVTLTFSKPPRVNGTSPKGEKTTFKESLLTINYVE